MQQDITALGACHGHIINLMNIFTGERYAYAALFVLRLLQAGIRPEFVWYDINCRWSIFFKRFMEAQPEELRALVEGLQFPLPVWHLYAHRCCLCFSFGSMPYLHAGRSNLTGAVHEVPSASGYSEPCACWAQAGAMASRMKLSMLRLGRWAAHPSTRPGTTAWCDP